MPSIRVFLSVVVAIFLVTGCAAEGPEPIAGPDVGARATVLDLNGNTLSEREMYGPGDDRATGVAFGDAGELYAAVHDAEMNVGDQSLSSAGNYDQFVMGLAN